MVTEDGEVIMETPSTFTVPNIGIFFKTPYNHDTTAEALRTATYCADPTLTQQHFKDEADINTIVDRFLKTGQMPEVAMPPTNADFEEAFDFQTSMNKLVEAKRSFEALPARVRATFNHDPGKFVDYVDHCLETGDLTPLAEMGLTVDRPPEPDRTTLGDVLKAVKEQGTPRSDSTTPKP